MSLEIDKENIAPGRRLERKSPATPLQKGTFGRDSPAPKRASYNMCGDIELYEEICQVGEGTYGKVFKARKKDASRQIVAVKALQMGDTRKEGFPITALREITLLKRLNHVNVVRLIELCAEKESD